MLFLILRANFNPNFRVFVPLFLYPIILGAPGPRKSHWEFNIRRQWLKGDNLCVKRAEATRPSTNNLFKPTAKKQEHTLLIAKGGDR